MGGNLVAKYLGEAPERVPPQVCAGVGVSAPLDLAASVRALERGAARLYQAYLMRSLKAKMRAKAALLPEALSTAGLDAMRTFRQFDDAYTAPLNGFADAADYYARNGAARVLEGVGLPLLVLNAADDPFLGRSATRAPWPGTAPCCTWRLPPPEATWDSLPPAARRPMPKPGRSLSWKSTADAG
jgi:predicted alpha/beta-fold hydrolase